MFDIIVCFPDKETYYRNNLYGRRFIRNFDMQKLLGITLVAVPFTLAIISMIFCFPALSIVIFTYGCMMFSIAFGGMLLLEQQDEL